MLHFLLESALLSSIHWICTQRNDAVEIGYQCAKQVADVASETVFDITCSKAWPHLSTMPDLSPPPVHSAYHCQVELHASTA